MRQEGQPLLFVTLLSLLVSTFQVRERLRWAAVKELEEAAVPIAFLKEMSSR